MMSAGRIRFGLVTALLFCCGGALLSDFLQRQRRDQAMELAHYRSAWERRMASLIASQAVEELGRAETIERIRTSDEPLKTAAEVFREIGESFMKENFKGEVQASANPDATSDRRDVNSFAIKIDDHQVGFHFRREGESIIAVVCPFKPTRIEIVTLSLPAAKAVHDTWYILPSAD
jgi:hypothetical protein